MFDLTAEAIEGRSVVAGAKKSNPHMFSSPAWLAYEAGFEARGLCDVKSARMSRGYSVRIDTPQGGALVVKFDGKNLDRITLERRG